LNGKGWLLTDVAKSLKILKNKSNDPLLQMVADNCKYPIVSTQTK